MTGDMSDLKPTAPIIQVRNLHKSFTLHTQGGIKLDVLSSTDLSVAPGDCVALMGPSGAGKSTVLRCLYGNYLPQSGAVLIRHKGRMTNLVGAEPRVVLALRRETLGYVSQFLRVIPRIASIDLVSEPLITLGVEPEAAREKAATLLTRLRIPTRHWDLAPATFSGGEQQRINIARTMVVDYPALLLDEPTASLDADNRQTVIELILEARDRGAAVVGIFHDEEVRDAVCTHRHHVAAPDGNRDAPDTVDSEDRQDLAI
ncbi:phosphonate C-P lyase system protein PhnL [Pelagibius sp. Alg239-R121]|uniref:phosphonate C-P lyase system protein PhnL n=1 Tax=Pelagibius sp. Alg239-R121 TaxID=2993448 RepID=UPI0024A6D1AB|nr:phosphonate C-P lyase system protein PhnL [Pelagibius sp. Alg239-R121]